MTSDFALMTTMTDSQRLLFQNEMLLARKDPTIANPLSAVSWGFRSASFLFGTGRTWSPLSRIRVDVRSQHCRFC